MLLLTHRPRPHLLLFALTAMAGGLLDLGKRRWNWSVGDPQIQSQREDPPFSPIYPFLGSASAWTYTDMVGVCLSNSFHNHSNNILHVLSRHYHFHTSSMCHVYYGNSVLSIISGASVSAKYFVLCTVIM